MSFGRASCVSLLGLNGSVVEIEADISSGLPGFVIVGLPDTSLSESRDRVRAAVSNSGYSLPARKITVNLVPAFLPKRGSGFDLAIAVAIMAAAGFFPVMAIDGWIFLAELSLDGRLRPVPGVLPAVLVAVKFGFKYIVVASENFVEASLVEGIRVESFSTFGEVLNFYGAKVASFSKKFYHYDVKVVENFISPPERVVDFSEIVGQDDTKFALEVAAVGGHNVLLVGPPGSGKTMLAERLVTILPKLRDLDALEVSALYSLVSSFNSNTGLISVPPFQNPHHSVTLAAMVGGGSGIVKPGSISLAHCGVLFLDEAPHFKSQVLDALREPLEKANIVIHRSGAIAQYPARFQLILAANPCLCGNYFAKGKNCTCTPMQRIRYFSKLSAPLLDRVDLRLYVKRVSFGGGGLSSGGVEDSSRILARVERARASSVERLSNNGWFLNSQVSGIWLRESCRISGRVTKTLDMLLQKGKITLRGYDRTLRVAWSVADLAGRSMPDSDDISMALFLRQWEEPI